MRKISSVIYWVVAFFIMSACSSSHATNNGKEELLPLKKNQDYLVKITTPLGDMYAVLYNETPQHRANFIKLINEKYYDGLLFHRVIQDFMIQGGDPKSKGASKNQALGQSGPGYTIPAEILPNKYHFKGTLAAARTGNEVNPTKASSGSQFYVVQGKKYTEQELHQLADQRKHGKINQLYQDYVFKPENGALLSEIRDFQARKEYQKMDSVYAAVLPILEKQYVEEGLGPDYTEEAKEKYAAQGGVPFLDGEYTVFGELVSGWEVIDKLATIEKGQADRPVEDISMTISYEVLSKKEISKRTKYRY